MTSTFDPRVTSSGVEPTREPLACPSWCSESKTCRGEHWGTGSYVAAGNTSIHPDSVDQGGARIPAVGISASYEETSGNGLSAVLHVASDRVDTEVRFRPDEAVEVAANLVETINLLVDLIPGRPLGFGEALRLEQATALLMSRLTREPQS